MRCVTESVVQQSTHMNMHARTHAHADTHLEGLLEVLVGLADRLERRGAVEVVHAADQVGQARVQAVRSMVDWWMEDEHQRRKEASTNRQTPSHTSQVSRHATHLASSCSARSMLLDMRFTYMVWCGVVCGVVGVS